MNQIPSESEKSKPRASGSAPKKIWLHPKPGGAMWGQTPMKIQGMTGDPIPYVLEADADRLAKALRACKIRVPVDMDPPCEDGNLAAWKEAEAALAAYEGGGS